MKTKLLFIIGCVTHFLSYAQLSGTYTIPGTYTSVAAIVNDLNTLGISGPVTINIAAGYTENVTVVGGIRLTATGTSANPIIFQKSGSGANPKLIATYAGTATPSSAAQDGIFSIIGGDYITIDGLDLQDNNTSNPATMEYGYGFFKASATNGCQNNTIKNCVVTLNNINNATGSGPSLEGSKGIAFYNATPTAMTTNLTITSASGAHSNNIVQTNTVQNCNIGIYLYGYAAASPFTLADSNNDIGGTTSATGNTIINFGGGGTANSYGIYYINQWNINVSNNLINNNPTNSISNHTGPFYGIYSGSATSANITITNNTVSIQSGGTTSLLSGIYNLAGSTASSNTVNISNNVINPSYTTATSSTFYGIYNTATPAYLFINNNSINNYSYGSGTATGINYLIYQTGLITGSLSINSNTINNVNINGTGTTYLCYNSNGTPNYSFSNNLISNITRTSSATGTMYGLYNFGSPSGGTVTISSNTLSSINQSSTTSTSFYGFYHGTSNTQNINCTNNILNNIQSGTGTMYNIYISYGNLVNIVSNKISNISHAGTYYGIYGGTSSTYTLAVTGNTINTLSLNGATTNKYIIYLGAALTNASNQCIKNIIGDITNNGTSGSIYGIYITSASDNQIINNIVGDIKAPNLNNANGIYGLYVNSGTTVKLYYNTIHLNATSSGTDFGSTAVFVSTTPANVFYRNNIFINNSIPNGTGLTVAHRRSSSSLTNMSFPTDNNIYYAGNPGPSNLIFYDGTNAVQTINAYKTLVAPFEANSYSENTPFISTIGTSSSFLHINNTSPSLANNGAVNISGITDDIDGDIRQGNPGYAGFGSAPDIGADEYDPLPCSGTPTAGVVVSSNTLMCNGNSATLLDTTFTFGSGITLQWQISGTGSVGTFTNISGANNPQYTTPTLTTGVYYYRLVVTCTISSQADTSNVLSITVNPVPGATASVAGSNTVCLGSPINLIGSTDIGTSFLWTGPNNFTSAVANPTIAPSTFSATGTYSFQATLANCSSPISTVYVMVYPTPGGVITPSFMQHCGSTANDTLIITNFNNVAPSSCGLSSGPCTGPTTLITIGTGNFQNTSTTWPSVYGNWYKNARHQFLIKASELLAAGVQPGKLSSLSFSVVSIPSGYIGSIPGFQISMKCVPASYSAVSTNFDNAGFTTVYGPVSYSPVVGWNTHNFPTPYEWDGSSNLLVDVCYTLNTANPFTSNPIMSATTLTYNALVYNYSDVTPMCGTATGITDYNRPDIMFENCPSQNPSSYTFSWSPSTGLSNTTNDTVIATPSTSTIYTVTVSNSICSSMSTSTINVFPNPTITPSSNPSSVCYGQTATLTATGANTYTWITSFYTTTTTVGTGSNIAVTPSVNTTYTIYAVDSNNCPGNAVFNLTVNPTPTVYASGTSPTVCAGSPVSLFAFGANSYTWSNGSTGYGITVTPSVTTTYTVTGSNAYNCSNTATISVQALPVPTINVSAVPSSSFCTGGAANLIPTGATSYTYSTYMGPVATGTSYIANPTITTTYTVSGTGTNGCVGNKPIVLTVFPNPNITVTTTSAVSCPGSSVVLTANGASTYTWSTSSNSNTIVITPTISTTYTVSGTNSNGCTGSTTYNQLVTPCVGIEELLSNSETIEIYPNPGDGHFNMIVSSINSNSAYLEIYDMSGRVVFKLTSNETITPIDITNLATGIYYYTIKINDVIKKGKLIKE